MLQLTDKGILESSLTFTNTACGGEYGGTSAGGSFVNYDPSINGTTGVGPTGYWIGDSWYPNYHPIQTVWMGYPVYVCSDKTAKAIEVLKFLQKEKAVTCNSVPKFIELVEKISAIL